MSYVTASDPLLHRNERHARLEELVAIGWEHKLHRNGERTKTVVWELRTVADLEKHFVNRGGAASTGVDHSTFTGAEKDMNGGDEEDRTSGGTKAHTKHIE